MGEACCSCGSIQTTLPVPLVPAAAAGERRSDVPGVVLSRSQPQGEVAARPIGSTEARAACPSIGPAPPVDRAPLGKPRLKHCPVEAAAAVDRFETADVMLCVASTQPATSGASSTSGPAMEPKQRPPCRFAGRRARPNALPTTAKAKAPTARRYDKTTYRGDISLVLR